MIETILMLLLVIYLVGFAFSAVFAAMEKIWQEPQIGRLGTAFFLVCWFYFVGIIIKDHLVFHRKEHKDNG